MQKPLDIDNYSISQNGFLPEHLPLEQLPDPSYSNWEDIAANLPTLIKVGRVRDAVLDCPILSTDNLASCEEWMRAYVLLTYISHAYIWGGDYPAEVMPPQLSIPLLQVSKFLDLPPILTCAAANLWNYTSTSTDLSDLNQLQPLVTFSGTETETRFLMVGVAVEAKGGEIYRLICQLLEAAQSHDYDMILTALKRFASCIREMTTVLTKLLEKCDPMTFYYQVRPFYAGTMNMEDAGLPKGVFYDEGNGKGEWKQLRGGSNGQSSLFQLIDLALGVHHNITNNNSHGNYYNEILEYMPGDHRRFLQHFARIWDVRRVVHSPVATPDMQQSLRSAHNITLTELAQFRTKHIQIVSKFVVIPSKKPPAQSLSKSNLAIIAQERSTQALTGTSGTQLMPFLKQARDETLVALDLD